MFTKQAVSTNGILKAVLCINLLVFIPHLLKAQETSTLSADSIHEIDATDVLRKIFNIKSKKPNITKANEFAMIPALGYNPSFGFTLGAKITGGRQFGTPPATDYSVFSLEAIYTTKGIKILQLRHNVFTPNNIWNWQGHWQISKMGMQDYGVGTGNSNHRTNGLVINDYSTINSDSSFPVDYNYLRLSEKVYHKTGENLFVGAGLSFDMHSKINDEKVSQFFKTPHYRYSVRNDFSTTRYATNGLLLALQFNTREHPIRSYGGLYADMTLRFNQTWLGSTKNSTQLLLDVRKYISLSNKKPEAVIAFWHWASYLLGGSLPYLQMPSTASDTYARMGRAYTFGRFKGPSYSYFESELRYPITRNKLFSGVCFVNMQTASDDLGKPIFNRWEPGAGAGLRILFQKNSRTNLCIDYAVGRYGSQGLFFGLSEVF
jgi:hypothetical protein